MRFSQNWRRLKKFIGKRIRRKLRRLAGVEKPPKPLEPVAIVSITPMPEGLRVVFLPALPAVDVRIQISRQQEGGVLVAQTLHAADVRIIPGESVETVIGGERIADLPEGEVLQLDLVQQDRHLSRRFTLRKNAQGLEWGYPSVESYLQATRPTDLGLKEVLPRRPEESLSMAHMSDHDFIQYVYFWLLGRDADPSGLTHYLAALQNGLSREKLIASMIESEESRAFRRLSPISISGEPAYPFSETHDRLRIALGAVSQT